MPRQSRHKVLCPLRRVPWYFAGQDERNEGVKFVEGYTHFRNTSVKLEASESYDEEDIQPSSVERLEGFSEILQLTLKQFYQNLGDLTNTHRYQPGYRRASRQAVLRRRKLRAEQNLKEGKSVNDHIPAGLLKPPSPSCVVYTLVKLNQHALMSCRLSMFRTTEDDR